MTGSRGSRRAGQGKLRACPPSASAAGGARGAAPQLSAERKAWGEGTHLPISPSPPLPISTRPVRVCGRGHSPRRGAHRAAGPDAARSAAPPPRRPRNAAPHRAMQPGQRHNTPRDIRLPAIGRRAERRARRPLSAAVTPAAREGAAGAHTPRTHSHKDRRAAPRGVRGALGGGAGAGQGAGAARGGAEPWRPRRRQPLSIGRPGSAARVNYVCPGQRRGVAGCGLGPARRTPSSLPVTYSAELGEFHSEATARRARSCGRQQRIRAAPAGAVNTGSHPRGPGADGPGRRCPPAPPRGIRAAAPRGDAAELRAVPPAAGILAQAWRRGPHRAGIDRAHIPFPYRPLCWQSRPGVTLGSAPRSVSCPLPAPHLVDRAKHMDVKFI